MSMPSWGVHRDHGALEAIAEKLRHANPAIATKLQSWIVILVDIGSGRMTADGAIPDDQALRHSGRSHLGSLDFSLFT